MAVKQSGDEDGIFFFSSRRRHTRYWRDWSSDVCSSDLPPEGLEYRSLGTMEHNICDILAQRMKGRKMSWSIGGANNLAKILAEKASKRIYTVINEVCSGIISEDKLDWKRGVEGKSVDLGGARSLKKKKKK